MADRMGPGDFYDLVKEYALQELVEPLRPIPRWIAFGVLGSLLLMISGVSLTLAALRVLQEETGSAFTGNLSWAPHAITLLGAVVVLALLAQQIRKRKL
ncbi:MAG: hypothetical protein OXF75_08345 [Acidimicrobiaceae bacterium]|nr:hypothetical protein [Acidimicrobiaceae bacterium]